MPHASRSQHEAPTQCPIVPPKVHGSPPAAAKRSSTMNRPRESPRNYQCIVMQGIETRLLVFASTTVDSRECRAFCRQQTPPGRQTACSTTATRRSELPRTKRMRRAGVCMRKAGSNKNKNPNEEYGSSVRSTTVCTAAIVFFEGPRIYTVTLSVPTRNPIS